jgi:hypothetical protein
MPNSSLVNLTPLPSGTLPEALDGAAFEGMRRGAPAAGSSDTELDRFPDFDNRLNMLEVMENVRDDRLLSERTSRGLSGGASFFKRDFSNSLLESLEARSSNP